jgi:hypothetical protein
MSGLTKPFALILSITTATEVFAAPDTSLYGRLVAACSGPRAATCQQAFEAALASLDGRESVADLDANLGLIAAAAVTTAQSQPQIARRMAEILREAAKAAGDPVQARTLLIVAELVQNGRAKEVLSQIFPASPS